MAWRVEIHHIDVGRGDSTLFVIRDGGSIKKVVLLDCGYGWAVTQHVNSYVSMHAASNSLDILIYSHSHGDHFGGNNKLNCVANTTVKYGNCTVNSKDNTFTIPTIGTDILNLGTGAPTMKCISNSRDLFSSTSNDRENRSSLCFKLDFGLFSYYTGGDMDGGNENTMATIIAQATFYKVAHHGSNVSSSDTFLQYINPRAAFISCGDDGTTWKHDHPTQSCLDRLWAKRNHVLNTFMTSCSLASSHVQSDPDKYQRGKMRVAGGYDTVNNKVTKPGDIQLIMEQQSGNSQTAWVRYYENGSKKWISGMHKIRKK